MSESIGTLANLVAEYGDPHDVGNGNPRAAGAAKHLAGLHQQRMHAITGSIERRGDNAPLASEQKAFDTHRSEATLLSEAAELYGQRSADEARVRAEVGEVGAANEWRTQPGLAYTSGGGTYRRNDPHGKSWLRDMANFNLRGDPDAGERLRRNDREVAVEHRALSTTDGAGGDFSPPSWLIAQYVDYARASRVTADLMRQETLPTGTDQLNVPKILTGTAAAEQATQNTAVQNTDATTGAIAANVATIAGQQVVSLQLIEQSPINVDTMLLQDLIADLSAKVDLFVLNNNVANKKGLLQETGTNSVTYTDATPTVAEFYSKLADAVRQVSVNTFQMPNAIIMSPMRWAWILAAVDGQLRPLVVPDASGPYNSYGTTQAPAGDGRVGSMMGMPVFVDPQVPGTFGAGTNEDRVLVLNTAESVLWSGALKAEAFREPAAANLSILLRVYEYVAFTAARRPKSISVIQGTGLVQPTL